MSLVDLLMPVSYSSGTLGSLVHGSDLVRSQLDKLTEQSASGMKSADFAGLSSDARLAFDLQPEIAVIGNWQANIDAADTRMQVTQAAMDRLTAIASDFYAKVNQLNGLDSRSVDTIAGMARDALREVAGLLNTRAGNIYVFAGQDTANAPVPAGDAILGSGFYAQIAAAVASLSVAGVAATITSTTATAASNTPGVSPFSAYLSQPVAALQSERPTVETGEQQRERIGILAGTNAAALSTSATSTGSYVRDLMRALAMIGSLSSSQVLDPGFAPLVSNIRVTLRDSIDIMTADAGILGSVQKALRQRQNNLDSMAKALTGQLASVQDADMALVLTRLSQVQIQLQSSYQMLATYGQMSLSHFLG